jgi:STE24 endopeptidase
MPPWRNEIGFIFPEGVMRRVLFTLLVLLSLAAPVAAQSEAPVLAPAVPRTAPTTKIEVAQLPPAGVASFSAEKATEAYLARLSPQEKAKSDAYFEGGYVLQVVDVIYGLVVAGLLLWPGVSRRMRELAERITRIRFWQVPIYVLQYIVVTTILTLPLAIYEGFIREHHYGLSNMTFAGWAGEFAILFAVQLAAMTVLLTIIYAVVRGAKRSWWVWGSGVAVVFMIVMIAIGPVYISPLTNHYTPLPESGMRNAILSLARANGIPADNVYTFDASKQSKRVSANVSGMFGTTRISLNDNLLNRCTPSEVLAVLGHEMGHYVLGHVTTMIIQFGLLIVLAFWFVDRCYRWLTSIFGGNWGAREIDDPAGLPVVMALISVFFFFATPVTNTIIRTNEIQADIFGLNAARQPDAFATVSLKLAEYRKLSPTPLEEFVFYDHPSGRNRILMAMRWKAEHLNDPDIMAGPISPQ